LASEDIVALVQRVLREGPFSMRQLADDTGLKYDVLRGWAIGRRTPSAENLSRMADGFEARAELLQQIAHELRDAAKHRRNEG
jgi:transcriptional regulator with XRE-family HTH domain